MFLPTKPSTSVGSCAWFVWPKPSWKAGQRGKVKRRLSLQTKPDGFTEKELDLLLQTSRTVGSIAFVRHTLCPEKLKRTHIAVYDAATVRTFQACQPLYLSVSVGAPGEHEVFRGQRECVLGSDGDIDHVVARKAGD